MKRWLILAAAVVVLLGLAAFALHEAAGPGYRYESAGDPHRKRVRDDDGNVVASVTEGARTVVVRGPSRTFAEPDTTTATVTTRSWVRLAPRPWRDGDAALERWLAKARDDRRPDILAIAMQYAKGAVDIRDAEGLRIAGAATYGPLDEGERAENSDFNDFLGVGWTYRDGTVRDARPDHLGALDCSGFVRMVFGYRSGYPLEWGEPTGKALPRRAVQMADDGPGVKVTDLQAGDLVFFDADPGDGPAVDHVGIYLGLDSAKKPRFLSSRKTANGPTMGDLGGAAVLKGTGFYARAFRSAKRL